MAEPRHIVPKPTGILLLALASTLLCGCRVTPTAVAVRADDWAAVEKALGIIRQCQMDDGMIRMKGAGDPVWAVPYFGNLAAIALLAADRAHPNPHDVARAGRWLLWYARNQEPDGTIFDREGTVAAYASNGKHDASDSYAATFLMAAGRHSQATGKPPPPEIAAAAAKALAAIRDVTQADGLTIARPDYPVKYLMDNIEVYQGLTEGARLFAAAGLREEARRARAMAARVAEGLGAFRPGQGLAFAYAIDARGRKSGGLAAPYPHGLAQVFALSWMTPPQPQLWAEVRAAFAPDDNGIPAERWLIAARRHAGPQETETLREAARSAAMRFSVTEVYVERPAMAIIALLYDHAPFPEVPRPPPGVPPVT